MNERRLAKIGISFELLFDWLTEGNILIGIKTIKGLPKNAVFVHAYPHNEIMWMLFEHESFAHVPLGCEVPELKVSFTQFHEPEAEKILLEAMNAV